MSALRLKDLGFHFVLTGKFHYIAAVGKLLTLHCLGRVRSGALRVRTLVRLDNDEYIVVNVRHLHVNHYLYLFLAIVVCQLCTKERKNIFIIFMHPS